MTTANKEIARLERENANLKAKLNPDRHERSCLT